MLDFAGDIARGAHFAIAFTADRTYAYVVLRQHFEDRAVGRHVERHVAPLEMDVEGLVLGRDLDPARSEELVMHGTLGPVMRRIANGGEQARRSAHVNVGSGLADAQQRFDIEHLFAQSAVVMKDVPSAEALLDMLGKRGLFAIARAIVKLEVDRELVE